MSDQDIQARKGNLFDDTSRNIGRLAESLTHHFALLFALFVVVGGCTSSKSIQSSSDVVYNNRGGLAYEGLRITFRSSGTYEMQHYTDVVERDTVAERGTYERQGSAYVLSHDGVRRIYHVVTVRGVEYLLDSRTFDDYSRTRDRGLLHGAMRRAS